jgi:hypothetical protein
LLSRAKRGPSAIISRFAALRSDQNHGKHFTCNLQVKKGRLVRLSEKRGGLKPVLQNSGEISGIFYKWLPESGCVAGGDGETPAFLERYNEEFDPRTGTGGWKCGSRSSLERNPGVTPAMGVVACQARWRRARPCDKMRISGVPGRNFYCCYA